PAAGAHARLVAAGIFLSRISGLVREAIFATYFGTTMFADVFRAALRIPNVLQNLLGEGTLSASFVPVYSELLHQEKKEEAGRLAGAVFAMLLIVAGAFSLFGVFAAPLMVDIFLYGFEGERRALAIPAIRIIFPMTGILVLSAWALGILNSHRKFFIPYVAPVLWSAAMIAAMLLLGHRMDLAHLLIALSWAALIGGVLQLAVQLPWVFKLERNLRVRWQDTRSAESREVVRNAWPAILGRGVVQISAWIDVFLASLLSVGAIAVLTYSTTLYLLPISLFGMSVAASELPDLARQRLEGADKLRERVRAGLRQIAVFVVPSVVAFFALGDIVVATLYQHGRFSRLDTVVTYIVLAGFTLGLQASTSTRLLSSTFFALHDTRRPALFATIRVVITGGLGYLMMMPFERLLHYQGRALGALGLSLAAGVGAWVEWGLLWRALHKRIGDFGPGWNVMLRMYAAALLAAAVGRGLDLVLPHFQPMLRGAIILAPFGVLYFVLAHLFGIGEASSVVRRVVRRRERSPR
ncbi:MAG TPA: murein biosynthesis integral membrane protein MurJ, partial [Longimicrobiales bacterium]